MKSDERKPIKPHMLHMTDEQWEAMTPRNGKGSVLA
jgi:hypothetical protein